MSLGGNEWKKELMKTVATVSADGRDTVCGNEDHRHNAEQTMLRTEKGTATRQAASIKEKQGVIGTGGL